MNTPHPSHKDLRLHLAWEFTDVLPGLLERNRKGFVGKTFPIVGPLPNAGRDTRAFEKNDAKPPYLYVVYDSAGVIRYVGKGVEAKLKTVLQRWIRPNKLDGRHYWTHGTNLTKKVATVASIADEINKGLRPVRLYFGNYESFYPLVTTRARSLDIEQQALLTLPKDEFIRELERLMIYTFQPEWNKQDKKRAPSSVIARCGDYWRAGANAL